MEHATVTDSRQAESHISQPPGDAPAAPLVSVIVPVRDNPDGIRELIGRLEAQTHVRGAFEVVIGDDGSGPGSLEGLEAAAVRLRVVNGAPRGSYAARNRAAAAARGRVLAFCDSDCLPAPNWLDQGLAALEGAEVVAGQVTFSAPPRPTAWSLLTIDMFLDQERNVILSRGVTANLFVARDLFEDLGGFEESLPSGGDYDLVARAVEAGARLAYAPEAVVGHPTLDERRPFLRKVWTTNRWSAFRRARAGARLELTGLLVFVPVAGVALARRQALRPVWRLCRPRLEASGLETGWRQDLRALPLLYFVVAYVAGLARTRGWLEGRRHAPSWTEPMLRGAESEPSRCDRHREEGRAFEPRRRVSGGERERRAV